MGTSSYVPPIVEVYQEYRSPNAIVEKPLLSAVVVGPCFHIRNYANNKDLIGAGAYNAVDGNEIFAPDAKPSMKLVASSVQMHVDNATVELIKVADAAFDFTDIDKANVLTSATAQFVTEGVQVGDAVYANGRDFKVLAVVGPTEIKLNKNLGYTQDETDLTIVIGRLVQDMEIAESHFSVEADIEKVTLNIGTTLTIDSKERKLLTGDLYMGYKALDVTSAFVPAEIIETDDITAKLGVIDGDENPLAQGAFVAYGNAARTIYAIGLESNDLLGWAKARDIIKKRGFYAKAILSQDPGVLSLFKALEVANADPKKSNYGTSIGNHKVTALEDDEICTGTAASTLTDASTTEIIILNDNDADFSEIGVRPGDLLTMEGVATDFVIDEVINDNRLKVMVTAPFASEMTDKMYTIHRILNDEQLATKISAISESFGNKRMIMTFADEVQIAGNRLPGYYLNCIVAGMTAGLPPHAGLSNKGVAVVEKVFNSNFKFEEDHLNIIAAGGTMIFVQDDEDSLPYIRHQLTTDRTSLETAEYSAVKTNDYISIMLRNTIRKFLGTYNVQKGLFVALRPALDADIMALKRTTSTELGAMLIEGKILELRQSELSKDQIEVVVDTVQPAPFNKGILRVIS